MLSVQQNERLTQVGRGTPMGELMRRYWHPVGAVAELEDRATKAVRLLGEDLVLYRDRSGTYGLIDRVCAHRRVDLTYGIPEEHGLRCMYHGWMYDETGQCIEQPFEETVHPDGRFKEKVKLTGYPVDQAGGLLFAYLGPAPVPFLPHWDLFERHDLVRHIGFQLLDCSWLQCMENSLDPVHTEWLHGWLTVSEQEKLGQALAPTSDGRPQVTRHTKIGFDVFEHGIIKRRVMEGQTEDNDDWRTGHPIIFPDILKTGTSGGYGFQIRVPVDDTHTFHVHYYARKPTEESGPAEQTQIPYEWETVKDESGRYKVMTNNRLAQDVMAWVTQGPIARRDLEKLGESDKGVILYRHLLERQMRVVEDGGDPMNVFRDAAQAAYVDIPTEEAPFMSLPNSRVKASPVLAT